MLEDRVLLAGREVVGLGRELDVEFLIPGDAKPIKATGTIRWLKVVVPDTMVECGFEFSNINAADRARIDAFAQADEAKDPPPQP